MAKKSEKLMESKCTGITLSNTFLTNNSQHSFKLNSTEEPGGLQSLGSLRVGHD